MPRSCNRVNVQPVAATGVGESSGLLARPPRTRLLASPVRRCKLRLRLPIAAIVLSGLTLAGVVSGCARPSEAAGSWQACRWHITPLPRAASFGGDITLISQPPHGRPWAISDSNANPLLRWTGTRWVVVPNRSGYDSVLGLSSRDVWLSGGTETDHWDGRRFSTVPNRVPGGDFGFLAGSRANSIWLMTYSDEDTWVAHWNGSSWSNVESPDLARNPAQTIAARGDRDVWIVAGWYPPAVLAHWDGSSWHLNTSKILTRAALSAVLDLGPHDVWAVGGARILHFDGRKWRVTPGPALAGSYDGPEIAGLRHGPLYAAGASRNNKALLLRWTRKRWVRVATPPLSGSSEFAELAVGSRGDVWAGGQTYRQAHGSPYQHHVRALIEHCVPRGRRHGRASGDGS